MIRATIVLGIALAALASEPADAAASTADDCWVCLPLLWCPEQSEGNALCEQACGNCTHWNGECVVGSGDCDSGYHKLPCVEG
jgi:hypothetical protein